MHKTMRGYSQFSQAVSFLPFCTKDHLSLLFNVMLLTFILACLRMALVTRISTIYQRRQKPVNIFLLFAELSPKLLVKSLNGNVKISQDASQDFLGLYPLCSSWVTFTEFDICHSKPGILTTSDCISLCRFRYRQCILSVLNNKHYFRQF